MPTLTATAVAPAWSDDAQSDLLRVLDDTAAAAEKTGYTETWIMASGSTLQRVLDPALPSAEQVAERASGQSATLIERDRLLTSVLQGWVLTHSTPAGTTRDGETFTTVVDNPTVDVMVVETRNGLVHEIRDYVTGSDIPVTVITVELAVTRASRTVLEEAAG